MNQNKEATAATQQLTVTIEALGHLWMWFDFI
jgi:hypothetical protein